MTNIDYENKHLFLVLANGDIIETLTPFVRNLGVTRNFNDTQEITFELLEKINDADALYELEFYETIELNRRILFEDIGEYIITNIDADNNGISKFKKLVCKSSEYEFNNEDTTFKGTVKLHVTTPTPEVNGIMNHILEYFPDWTMGYVDPIYYGEEYYRTFDIKAQKLYQLMITDIESAFDCIFKFDTLNKKINVYNLENVIEETDIYLAYDTILKHTNVNYNADEIVTKLDVTGGNLDIRRVNPMGENNLYDFSYYMNTNWMSQELISVINNWKNLVASYQDEYSNVFELYSYAVGELNILLPKIEDMQVRGTDVAQQYTALSYLVQTPEVVAQMEALFELNQEIYAPAEQYYAEKAILTEQKNTTEAQLKSINDICKLGANFTLQQKKELRRFIIKGRYENKAFSYTNNMTEEDKKRISKLLYHQGGIQLSRICKPRLTFDIDVLNFTKIIELQDFTDELDVGKYLYVQLDEWADKRLILTSIHIPDVYGNPKEIKLTFSDKLRHTDNYAVLNELINEVTKKAKENDENTEKIEQVNQEIREMNLNYDIQKSRIDTTYSMANNISSNVADLRHTVQEIIEGSIQLSLKQYDAIPTPQQIIADKIVVGDVVLVKAVV